MQHYSIFTFGIFNKQMEIIFDFGFEIFIEISIKM